MQKKQALRLCIACSILKDKKELLRVVKNGEDISIDRTGKKNGRGAYICDNIDCLKKAVKSKTLDRSFKQKISLKIYDKLLEEMETKDE